MTLPLQRGDRPARLVVAGESSEWRDEVVRALQIPGVEILEAKCCADVMSAAHGSQPVAAIVVHAFLADATGLGLCRMVRESERGDVPLLMVSPYAGEIDRVLAFENGVDDFVTHPFFDRELASRVRAVLRRDARRGPGEQPAERGRYGPLKVDLRRSAVEVEGHRVRLTLREFDVLRRLIEQEGRVLARADLLAAEGTEAASPRVVDTHVKSIRRKLGGARHCIETVRGVGYRFSADLLKRSS